MSRVASASMLSLVLPGMYVGMLGERLRDSLFSASVLRLPTWDHSVPHSTATTKNSVHAYARTHFIHGGRVGLYSHSPGHCLHVHVEETKRKRRG